MADILIVEDDAPIAKLLQFRLEQRGYTLTVVADGEEALASVHAREPDLVLLDVMLPSMSGFQVARRLKFDITTHHIPIVMLTARADAESMMAGIERGADVYLTKPIDFPALLRAIETCLRQHALPARHPPADA